MILFKYEVEYYKDVQEYINKFNIINITTYKIFFENRTIHIINKNLNKSNINILKNYQVYQK